MVTPAFSRFLPTSQTLPVWLRRAISHQQTSILTRMATFWAVMRQVRCHSTKRSRQIKLLLGVPRILRSTHSPDRRVAYTLIPMVVSSAHLLIRATLLVRSVISRRIVVLGHMTALAHARRVRTVKLLRGSAQMLIVMVSHSHTPAIIPSSELLECRRDVADGGSGQRLMIKHQPSSSLPAPASRSSSVQAVARPTSWLLRNKSSHS